METSDARRRRFLHRARALTNSRHGERAFRPTWQSIALTYWHERYGLPRRCAPRNDGRKGDDSQAVIASVSEANQSPHVRL
jgi:hypothetical protein